MIELLHYIIFSSLVLNLYEPLCYAYTYHRDIFLLYIFNSKKHGIVFCKTKYVGNIKFLELMLLTWCHENLLLLREECPLAHVCLGHDIH